MTIEGTHYAPLCLWIKIMISNFLKNGDTFKIKEIWFYYKYNNRKWYFMPTFQSLMSCWFCRKAKTKTLHSPAYLPFLCFLNLCLTRRKVQSKGLIKSFYRIFRFEVCRIMLTCVYDESCIRCYFRMIYTSAVNLMRWELSHDFVYIILIRDTIAK